MAAEKEEKTEAPTPRRRSEARAGGQVARSQDLTAAVLTTTAFLSLYLFGPKIWQSMIALTAAFLSVEAPVQMDDILHFAGTGVMEMVKRLAPFLLVLFVAILLTLYSQIGFLFTLKPLTPSLSKINPLNGIKRIFSARSMVMALISFGKLVAVGALAYITLVGGSSAIIYAFTFDYMDVFGWGLP